MSQVRLFVTAGRKAALRAAELLEAAFDDDGLPVATFETDEKLDLWTASLYAPADREREMAARMKSVLKAAGLDCEIGREALADVDWVSKTLGELKPVRAGRFLVHGSHDRSVPKPFERAVEIDAAMAFGTGHHGTTAGCLDMIGRVLKNRRFARALDIGTGTGVLAIAVARSLPVRVLASDIDPVSTAIARDNCRLNGVAGRVACITAAGLHHPRFRHDGPFDLIVANILAGPLQAMARDLVRHAAPGATVILSGLLPHQKARILASYRLQGLVLEHAHIRDNWLTLVLRRPAVQRAS